MKKYTSKFNPSGKSFFGIMVIKIILIIVLVQVVAIGLIVYTSSESVKKMSRISVLQEGEDAGLQVEGLEVDHELYIQRSSLAILLSDADLNEIEDIKGKNYNGTLYLPADNVEELLPISFKTNDY